MSQTPPADNPEAILLWLYWRHLAAGRITKRREHEDPFWRRVDAKGRDRLRLAASLRADPGLEERVSRTAALLDLADVARKAGVSTATVSRALSHPAMVADATREPSEFTATAVMPAESPRRTMVLLRATSHTRMVWSLDAKATTSPFPLIAT